VAVLPVAAVFVAFLVAWPPREPVRALSDTAGYRRIVDAVSGERLAGTIRRFASQGTRIPGSPGNAAACAHIEERLDALGLDVVRWPFKLVVPRTITAEIALCAPDPDVPGLEIVPMWPNVVRTPTLETPIEAEIVFAPQGRAGELDGRVVEGGIVAQLSGDWQTAATLGAGAVLYLDPEGNDVPWRDTSVNVAVDMPRFLLRCRDRSVRGEQLGKLLDGRTVRLECEVELAEREVHNLLARIDPAPRSDADRDLPSGCLILTAHIDSTSCAPDLAPGATQAIGAATLLEIAEALAGNPPPRPVYVLFLNAHFEALAGACDFFAHIGDVCEPKTRIDLLRRRRDGLRKDLPEIHDLLGALDQSDVAGLTNVSNPKLLLEMLHLAVYRRLDELDEVLERHDGADVPAEVRSAVSGYRELLYMPIEKIVARRRDDLAQLVPSIKTILERQIRDAEWRVKKLDLALDVAVEFAQYSRKLCLSLNMTASGRELFTENRGAFTRLGYGTGHTNASRTVIREARQMVETLGGAVAGFTFMGPTDPRRTSRNILPYKLPGDNEAATGAGIVATSFGTTHDFHDHVHSPYDLPDAVDMDVAASQARLLAALAYRLCEISNGLVKPLPRSLGARWSTVEGRLVRFVPGESLVASRPAPDALIALDYITKNPPEPPPAQIMGVRARQLSLTDDKGTIRTFSLMRGPTSRFNAYKLAGGSGRLTMAKDLGRQGEEKFQTEIVLNEPVERPTIVAMRGMPTSVFGLFSYRRFLSPKVLEVIDPHDLPPTAYYAHTDGLGSALVMAQRGVRFRLIARPILSAAAGRMDILLNATEKKPLGKGFAAGTPRILRAAYQSAQDTHTLDADRLADLTRASLANEALTNLHGEAGAYLETARTSLAERRYADFLANTQLASAYEERAYPYALSSADDAIKGIIFYMFLLLPCSFFLERLLIGASDIRRQLTGWGVIFVGVFFLLALVHPAFRLTMTPLVILLAFVILALSILVVYLISQKFGQNIAELRARIYREARVADIGRFSTVMAALSLGVSNMRKRKVRTALTTVTLVLLTFTVLSFTSIKSVIRLNRIRLNDPEKNPAPYQGLLLKDHAWGIVPEQSHEHMRLLYGRRFDVLPRAWGFGKGALGSARMRECFVMETAEPRIVGYDGALLTEEMGAAEDEVPIGELLDEQYSWFDSDDSAPQAIVTENVASRLGITPEDVLAGGAFIKAFGREYRVRAVTTRAPEQGLDRIGLLAVPTKAAQFVVGGAADAGLAGAPPAKGKTAPEWLILSEPGEVFAWALLGVVPAEARATRLDRYVNGTWFEADDEPSCIVSATAATNLGLSADDLSPEKPLYITTRNKRFLVRGILDDDPETGADRINDLNDEALWPVDREAAMPPSVSGASQEQKLLREETAAQVISRPEKSTHFKASDVLIVPYEQARRMDADIITVGVNFGDVAADEARGLVEEQVRKSSIDLFAGIGGGAWYYNTAGSGAFAGTGNILLPMLIAAAIVLNTMMGAVIERMREISTYSAVGLSPMHVGLLFLAESLVYATLGAVLGYLAGQGAALVISKLGLLKITLNFSSLATVTSTLIVMAVVILSTLYPASKAARLASPSRAAIWVPPTPEGDVLRATLPFTFVQSDAVGVIAFLHEYFDTHIGGDAGGFMCDPPRAWMSDLDGAPGFFIEAACTLAPYEFGVSQRVRLAAVRGQIEDIYALELTAQCASGDLKGWQRLNAIFLKDLRKYLLMWRAIGPAKENYIQSGFKLLSIPEEMVEYV